ncbi:MAG: glycoside hydrolase family 2 TIM barrel-domain containing protein [Rikenellaceae bacterium]
MKRLFLLIFLFVAAAEGLAAREVIAINNNWKFYFSSENSADYARTISLPHTWTYEQSRVLVSTQPTTANYHKSLYLPAEWAGKRFFVKFYGVQSVGDVLVNGRYVGEHRGGATAFTLEITDYITTGQENRVHVIVNNAPQSDILPTSQEEDIYGGIYRNVELIVTDKTAISPLYYGSDGLFVESTSVDEKAAEGTVRVHLNSRVSNQCQLTVSAFDPSGKVVFQKIIAKAKIGEAPISVPFTVDAPQLWSPEEPNLYTFVATLSDGDFSDKVEISTGFRSIELVENGFMKINGEPVQFRGVSLYHDYPHVGGAASPGDIDADMAIIEELGANAIRSVTNPHHPHLYDLCDAKGKLVWIDFPLVKAPFLSDIAYYPTDQFHKQGRETLNEIIAQNYNHPSVVMWGIFSLLSSRGDNSIPYIKELNALSKNLDPTRPTVAVSDQDGEINAITDLIVWNQTLGWDKGLFTDIDVWSSMLHAKWSSMRSAVVYGQNGRLDQQSSPEEYKSTNQYNSHTWKPEGRQRLFHEEYAQRLLPDSMFWGVCLNSMFDFKSSRNAQGENNSGLVTFDRRSRKDIFYLYKSQWNESQPTLYIADKRNPVTKSNLHSVKVYASEGQEPILCTQSDTLPMKAVAPSQFVADSVALLVGPNKLVVRSREAADSVVVILEAPASISTTLTRGVSRSTR